MALTSCIDAAQGERIVFDAEAILSSKAIISCSSYIMAMTEMDFVDTTVTITRVSWE
jgi:hypothetical protein